MTGELKIIKKYYGEEMMHYVRSNFATLLEKDGLLLSLIDKHFYRSKNFHYIIYIYIMNISIILYILYRN